CLGRPRLESDGRPVRDRTASSAESSVCQASLSYTCSYYEGFLFMIQLTLLKTASGLAFGLYDIDPLAGIDSDASGRDWTGHFNFRRRIALAHSHQPLRTGGGSVAGAWPRGAGG